MIFKDNSKKIKGSFNKAMNAALIAIGQEASGFAKERITDAGAVDTGRLRNSVTWATKRRENKKYHYKDDEGKNFSDSIGSGAGPRDVFVGTNVPYAPGIEDGTHRKAGAVHFLRSACSDHGTRFRQLVMDAMKKY